MWVNNMQAIQLQLGNLPLSLTCFMNATISLAPTQQFKAIVDGDVKIDMLGITVGDETYEYNTQIAYKEDEKLLKWLQSLNMTMPSFQQNHFGFGF